MEQCLVCKSTKKVEYHNIKSVANLTEKIQNLKVSYYNYQYVFEDSRRYFDILHLLYKKKQIQLCFDCYYKIYNNFHKMKKIKKRIQELKKIL